MSRRCGGVGRSGKLPPRSGGRGGHGWLHGRLPKDRIPVADPGGGLAGEPGGPRCAGAGYLSRRSAPGPRPRRSRLQGARTRDRRDAPLPHRGRVPDAPGRIRGGHPCPFLPTRTPSTRRRVQPSWPRPPPIRPPSRSAAPWLSSITPRPRSRWRSAGSTTPASTCWDHVFGFPPEAFLGQLAGFAQEADERAGEMFSAWFDRRCLAGTAAGGGR